MSDFRALVPVMTSNTTPEGECGASSVLSGFPAYYAFNGTTYDRSKNGRYWSANGATNQYVYYKFTSPVKVSSFSFVSSEANGSAQNDTTVVLIGSNDGTNWTDIQTYDIVAKPATVRTVYELAVNHPATYLYFGIKFPNWPQGNAQAGEVQFYSDEQVLVPVMTSNTTPTGYGECICSSNYGANYDAYIAFNGSTFNLSQAGTFWGPTTQDNTQWVGFKFLTKKIVTHIKFKTAQEYSSGGYSGDIEVIASNDAVNWTVLKAYTITSPYWTNPDPTISLDVPKNKGYLCYAVRFKYQYANAGEMQFYGDPNPHEDAAGDITAIRDWLNSSLYNKDEITDLFVQNNSGLQAYDLTLIGEQDQLIRVVGQTSGKSYTICLDMLGEDMKETVLWTNSGSTNPNTITLADDWMNYKFIMTIGKYQASAGVELVTGMMTVTRLNELYNNSQVPMIGFDAGTQYIWYKLTGTNELTLHGAATYVIDQILGYV